MESKYTPQERLDIYKKCLKRVRKASVYGCFICWALVKAVGEPLPELLNIYPEEALLEQFPELYAQKPLVEGTVWFHANTAGKKQRIDCLKAAIELVKQKIK